MKNYLSYSALKGESIPKAHVKKLHEGLKMYRAKVSKLRAKAAKAAKITDAQYQAYLDALVSDECTSQGKRCGVKAAEIAKISDAKFTNFSKIFRELKLGLQESASSYESSSMDLSEDKLVAIKITLRKLYAKIQDLRKQFHVTKVEAKKDSIRHTLKSFKTHYNKIYALLNGTPYYAIASDTDVPAPAPAVPDATSNLSAETQALLSTTADLTQVLNLIQGDAFYKFYSGPFSSWLINEKGSPTDEQIVKWLSKKLSTS